MYVSVYQACVDTIKGVRTCRKRFITFKKEDLSLEDKTPAHRPKEFLDANLKTLLQEDATQPYEVN